MANTNSKSIAVLGGGVTGLAAAWRLHALGHRVRLFEAADQIGGAVRSERSDGWLAEAGPNTLQVNSRETAQILRELGLEPQQLVANPAAKKRFLVRAGRLQTMPMSPPALLTSSLFSAPAKLRLVSEIFAHRRARSGDLSMATFVRDHFGQEFVDYALEPFVAGIFAGDPEKLSARHAFPKLLEIERTHGSLIRGQIAAARAGRTAGNPPTRLVSFADGLQKIPDTLAAALPPGAIQLGAKVTALLPGSPWRVTWQQRDGATQTEDADAIVLALPAAALTALRIGPLDGLRASQAQPLAALNEIDYPPVASLFLGYRREDVAHPLDGFGCLVPKVEKRSALGILFSSTLFPGRAPAGHVALTIVVGGARNPELACLNAEALLARVSPDLRDLLGVRGQPAFLRHTFWPRAIPQYNMGYDRFLDVMAAAEAAHPGLFIGGHVRDGIALGACLASGLRLAARAAAA